jgi:hypothetical protein
MLIVVLVFFIAICQPDGIRSNTTISTIVSNRSLPIEQLLHQQYDQRQLTFNRTNASRPWKKSNSIAILKKMIANRQRLVNNNNNNNNNTISRILTSTSLTSNYV